jgi:hypothetical protein
MEVPLHVAGCLIGREETGLRVTSRVRDLETVAESPARSAGRVGLATGHDLADQPGEQDADTARR